MDITESTAEKKPEEKLLAPRKYRYRLYPDESQNELLLEMMETHRRVWNELLGMVMDALKSDVIPKMSREQIARRALETGANEKDLAMEDGARWRKDVLAALKARGWTDAGLREALRTRLRKIRKTNPCAGRIAISILDAVVINLVRSWGAYRASVRGAKLPRFKRRGDFAGIAAPARSVFWLHEDRVEISSLELEGKRCPLRFVKHREMPSVPKSAVVTKEGSRWFVSFSVEVPIAPRGAHRGPAVGIDRGVVSMIADSTGRTAAGLAEDPARARKKRRLERSVARKVRGSSNWHKAQAKLVKHMQKTTRRRDDFLHKESLHYAEQYGTVVIERLEIANMTRSAKGTVEEPGKNVRAKAGLNRSILQQGWGRLAQYLRYKCEARGGTVLDVDPKNTSRTCAECGVIDSESRDGKDFECTACGHRADADVNAARVILALGMRGEVAPAKKPSKKLHSVVGKKNSRAKKAAGEVADQPVEDKRSGAPAKQELSAQHFSEGIAEDKLGAAPKKPRRKSASAKKPLPEASA